MRKHGFTRREFLEWAAAATAVTGFSQTFLPKLGAALQEAVKEYPLIWMQAAACSGCSVSVINTIHPSIKNVILDQILPGVWTNRMSWPRSEPPLSPPMQT